MEVREEARDPKTAAAVRPLGEGDGGTTVGMAGWKPVCGVLGAEEDEDENGELSEVTVG